MENENLFSTIELTPQAAEYFERLKASRELGKKTKKHEVWQLVENYKTLEYNSYGTTNLLKSEKLGKLEKLMANGEILSDFELVDIAVEIELAFPKKTQ